MTPGGSDEQRTTGGRAAVTTPDADPRTRRGVGSARRARTHRRGAGDGTQADERHAALIRRNPGALDVLRGRSGARAFAPRRSWWATSAAPSDTGIGLPTAGIGSPSLVASTTSKRSTTWAAPSNWRFRSSDRELRPVRADVEPESLSGVHECPQDGPRPESISSHSLRSIFSMGTSPLGGRDRMGILDQAPGWKSAIRSRPLASEQLSSRPRNTG